jgi:hypothetical protein
MRILAIVMATDESEAGVLPDEASLAAMGRFNEELASAGVLLAGEGLRPSSEGFRVLYDREGSSRVVAGPFAGPERPVAGFWCWRLDSLDAAIGWAMRCPLGSEGGGEIELRPMGCGGRRDPALDAYELGCVGTGDRPEPRREAFFDERQAAMRFMVMVRATKESESEASPVADEKLFREMGAFNEELVKAGVMLAGEGLQPSSKGARVRFSPDGSRTVIDGPFAETKELIAGFWLWQVKSLEECLEWVKRCPAPFPTECEIEVRRVYEMEDFGEALTPELRAQEERLREQTARLAK